MSRSKFDSLVKDGLLPKGKKRRGFKELVWYEDELNEYIR
jgi:predicted DNA-binding transcriptional regulator AlpA